ncbi:MAG: sugar phosphate nucleotidyltransferase [Oscillospiraceae bacterium]|nr:sugar phosphate nucleotidyltransferase [Oscillospiraceae bacterium]
MRAIIMAGGFGNRLAPLTINKPKPMVNVMGTPAMEHIINLLKAHSITEIGVTLQFMPQEIINYFKNGEDFGVNIEYFIETSPLGTAGSVKNAEEFLSDDFIVISGDAVTDIDLTAAIEFHRKKNAVATLVLSKVEKPLDYGVVVTDSDGRIERFLEKPDFSEILSDMANTGIYILNPKVLQMFPPGEFYDFGKDLFPKLLQTGEPMYGYAASGYWCDIGDTEAYIQCHTDIFDKKANLPLKAAEQNGVYVEDGVTIALEAVIKPPAYICSGANIQPGAVIAPYSVVGKGCTVKSKSFLEHAILWDNVTANYGAQVRRAVLCNNVTLGEHSIVSENTIIGENTNIGNSAIVASNIRIWANKNIDDNITVKDNMVWGQLAGKKLFCERGVCGEINVDITPEFASKLGAAFGSIMLSGAGKQRLDNTKVGIAFETHPSGDMLTNAVVAGLLSSGVQVYHFGEQALPISRSAIRFYGLDGGIHLSISKADNKQTLVIALLDHFGANITRGLERKLETAFIREDFVRCEPENIKYLMEVKNYKYYYLRDLINGIKSPQFMRNVELQTKSEMVSEHMASIFSEIEKKVSQDLGEKRFTAHISENGERITLYDKRGNRISPDGYLALCVYMQAAGKQKGCTVLPINTSSKIVEMAQAAGLRVSYSKTSDAEFMNQMLKSGCMEQFKLCYDGLYAAVKILDFLNINNIELDEMVAKIPRFYKQEVEIDCPDTAKGKVIKELISRYKDDKMEISEGIKIYKNGGWTLILPDNYKNTCRIIADGPDMETSTELCNIFENEMTSIIRQGKPRPRA